jgi:putative hemolysin
MWGSWLYGLSVLAVAAGLPIFSYLAIMYRELGRVTTGQAHKNLEFFENEIEPRFHMQRRHAARSFRLIAHFWLAFVILEMTRGVVYFLPGTWEALVQYVVFLGLAVVFGMHFLPDMLLYRTKGKWLIPFVPLLRVFLWLVWPVRVFLDGAESLARISEQDPGAARDAEADNEAIGALVDAAEEEGILEPEQADLIESVVEFTDKRVREVMTPRPDIVAVSADATLQELRKRFVETRFSRMPVFEKSPDDISGLVFSQDLLRVPETEMSGRRARELARHVLFVPETKSVSDLLREMRRKSEPMAVVIDEHGSLAGIVTVEDLVEEIVGGAGQPAADVARDADGSYVVRGSVSISSIEEILGIHFGESAGETVTTIAGLMSHVLGRVPARGDQIELEGYRFEVQEANQRKVLRVRIRWATVRAASEAAPA